MTKHRIELFSDGVFAIVLTLLVLDLKTPWAHGLAGLLEIAPALAVHAASFTIVGVLWIVHHGGLARVIDISSRTLWLNLLALFWVTLIPFAAKNTAERPFEPLGASFMAAICGAYVVSIMTMRMSAHSSIDDNPQMKSWRRGRMILGSSIALADFACAAAAWFAPWIGYVAVLGTMVILVLLPSPPEVEQRFAQTPD